MKKKKFDDEKLDRELASQENQSDAVHSEDKSQKSNGLAQKSHPKRY